MTMGAALGMTVCFASGMKRGDSDDTMLVVLDCAAAYGADFAPFD